MKIYGKIEKFDVVAMKCDCCTLQTDDILEIQEFLSWRDVCGYGNKTFGDMTSISIDLCQYCVKDLLGNYIKAVREYE